MYDYDHALLLFQEPLGDLFLTEHISLKKGLKHFSKDGAEAVVKKLRQLDDLNAIEPVNGRELTHKEHKTALDYHMYLKEKQDGRIKVRGSTDG
jgi:hypothetical protein